MDGHVRTGGGQLVAGHRRELLGFASAGLLAYAVDLGLFTWLRGPAGLDPLTAKALSFVAGCSVAYAGNALGTYRRTRTRGLRPYAVFFAVNAAGAAVQLLCLAVSHYGLGLNSQRADTVSGAGIGMVLGTALRFWGTRTMVFRSGDGAGDETGPLTRGGSGDRTRSWNRTSGGRVGSWTG
ncbi:MULTISPECIES: GtrA family protein [Streptomyces]|uniref:GtrA family protein n=1 Tax=Streptomyces TaxID=1883 RepID=UPI00240E848A|nr:MULTISPECIES: GtrA family protein [Streptomyces]WFB88897.1 GtrA family protein [Streptomyces olivaceus]WGK51236.1 GtrA family protein [Streptomyces sp. B146]